MKLYCIGDSITAGYGVATSYTTIINRVLAATIDNRAVCGARMLDFVNAAGAVVIGHLTQLRSIGPAPDDLVIWLAGFNDMRVSDLSVYAAAFKQGLETLAGITDRVYVGNCLRMPQRGYVIWSGSDDRVTEINGVIAAGCAQHGAHLVDASRLYDPHNTLDDLAHPNETGHEQIANAFLSAMTIKHRVYLPQFAVA